MMKISLYTTNYIPLRANMGNMMKNFLKGLWSSTFIKLLALNVVLGFVLRIVLLFNQETVVNFSFAGWVQIFLLGTFNDIFATILACLLMWLYLLFLSESKYKVTYRYLIFPILIIAYCIVRFMNTSLREFSPSLNRIIGYLLLWKLVSYGVRCFVPAVRAHWRRYTYYIIVYLYVLAFVFNVIAEYFFWNEFGVRYNFIAVDYLVYTNEVIGNMFESYPMIPLISVVVLLSLAVSYGVLRKIENSCFTQLPTLRQKVIFSTSYLLIAALSYAMILLNILSQHDDNNYVNELQANGMVKFSQAFFSNHLDYKDFYLCMPQKEAFRMLHNQYHSGKDNVKVISYEDNSEIHKNIVLITIESMSADYLEHYGNKDNLTPYLDKLIESGLNFTNLYAVGNRTVRGLEAVTLCVPPSPGESIIKQEHNQSLYSISTVLKQKGYMCQFIYGGDSYFDNMKTFFSGNGYQVIDQNDFRADEIKFKTVWGVCDEDMFRKSIKVLNADAATGKPFFAHIMTVSNHRPYTYPDGHINIPSSKKCREGGVKYTDYAIGCFFDQAKRQPWFKNTIFVVTADHCASSAGSTNIPLDEYHIPAVIYAPGFIKPASCNLLMSQIDILPTAFGLLHWNYTSRFYGQDVLSVGYHQRAYAATYEDLGYISDGLMTVLSPVRHFSQYLIKQHIYSLITGAERKQFDKQQLNSAISNYQTVPFVLKRK